MILRKCHPDRQPHVRAIFDQQAFGELERLVTQRLLEVLQAVAKEQLENDYWLRMVADLSGRSFEEMRVIVLEFLDTDVFHLSREQCVSFLDPMIESWDIDLATFALDITLNPRVVAGHIKRFEFVEREAGQASRGAGTQRIPSGSRAQRHGNRGGDRFSQAAEIQGQAADAALLLPGAQNLGIPLNFRVEGVAS